MVYTDGIHLIAESIPELHAFAKSIGLKKCWYHKGSRHPHYDLMLGKLSRSIALSTAIKMGAMKVSSRQLVRLSKSFYHFPTTVEEVEAFEEKHNWELKQPLSQETEQKVEQIRKNVLKKINSNNENN